MPHAVLDGIRTRYEVVGTGPAVLMFSPGGFDARLDNWRSFSIYARLGLLDRLAQRFSCITFDRRESGDSGGRVEPVAWRDYANQAKLLLDHLGIAGAHLMGGCVGCSVAVTFAVRFPAAVSSLVLYSPAGGPRYRMAQHQRFAIHAGYVQSHGLPAVAELALASTANFSADPRVGPWVSVLRADPDFVRGYVELPLDDYLGTLAAMCQGLFDRDTVPGVEAEQLLELAVPALIVPGQDQSHAPSAARYLQECLSRSEYWDLPVPEQTAANAPDQVLGFLTEVRS